MRFSRTLRICAIGFFGSLSLPVMAQEDAKTDSPASLFEQIDKDKDGKLTKEEVGEERGRFFSRLVRVADKDKDGILTKEEFIAGSQPEERPAEPQPGNPDGRRPQFGGFSEENFRRMDQNGDGKLTKDEIPAFLKERIQPVFERLGKEELTLEDLQRIAPNQTPADRSRMAEEFFKRSDANGDGKLTLEEAPEQFKPIFQGMLRRAGKGEEGAMTLEEFKQASTGGMAPGGFPGTAMPRALDTDRDGKLSKDELSKAVEEFGKLDRNGDGGLDPRELSGFGERANPNVNRNDFPNVDKMVDGIFERYDADKDGKLTDKEMAEMRERTKERMKAWDADQDGAVSKEEMTAAMKRSVQQSEDAKRRGPSRPESDN